MVGFPVGEEVGNLVGPPVGEEVGNVVGPAVGELVGISVSGSVAGSLGAIDGDEVIVLQLHAFLTSTSASITCFSMNSLPSSLSTTMMRAILASLS